MNDMGNKKESKSFWVTLPGTITALAVLITAIAGCLTAVVTWPRPNIVFPATLTPISQETTIPFSENSIPVELTATPLQTELIDTPMVAPPKYFLEVEQRLPVGEELQSVNQKFSLKLQVDGNLVLYKEGDGAIWATMTNNQHAEYLVLQVDGNLVLYGENGTVLWASESAGQIGEKYIFQLNDDGNLVIYNDGIPIWASNTGM